MSSPATHHVLLVEDSDDDAFFFQRALQRTGLPIRLVRRNDGADAIEYFTALMTGGVAAEAGPLMVFLDLKLPIFSGFDILQWLRGQGVLEKLKVAVLSGSESETDMARARQLGVEDYFVKPLGAEALQQTLAELLADSTGRQGRSWVSA